MTVKNRIVMAPMERNYANPDGTVSDRTLAHYEARARGGVGWIDVESTFVDPVGRGRTHQLGLHEDQCIDGFRALARTIQAHGCKVGIELHHAGRNTSKAISGHIPVAPSPVPCPEAGGDVPRELSREEINEIVERYARAAERAVEAGFDAVELHSAHGYLPLAFLSPLTNLRNDEYGGTLENRMRFSLQVIRTIKGRIPASVAVGCRFSADEYLPGGLNLVDTTAYARALEQSGVDYLSVSAGVYASFERIIPPMSVSSGWLLDTAATIKRAVTVPVVGVSRITDPRDADRAIAVGRVDLVAFGRALLTDPQFPKKSQAGLVDEIVTCIGCNQGCVERVANQLDVTCLVNPEVGREQSFAYTTADRPKRVLVVGGGPAGMEAARVCAERGHDVTLIERTTELGGQTRLAARLPHRPGWTTFVEQAEKRLRRSGVRIELGREADESLLKSFGADAIVIATGSRIAIPAMPGTPSVPVIDAIAALEAGDFLGTNVVVVGAGAIGLGVAEWLLGTGAHVDVVAPEAQVIDPEGQPGLLGRLLTSNRATVHGARQIARIAGDLVTLVRAGAIGPLFEQSLKQVTAVVIANERRPVSGLSWLARRDLLAGEIYEIGDCQLPRTALEAVLEGALVGRGI